MDQKEVTLSEVGHAKVSAAGLEAEHIFVFSHPSISYLDPFLADSLLWHGAGVLGVDHRFVANGGRDLDFRVAAEDVALAIRATVPEGRHVVLVGHSGGAPLMALVQSRFRCGQAMVFLAPHPSRAEILESWIDPSVGAEGARNADLDLFAPNRPLPLSREFVGQYRRAQRARVQQLASDAARALYEGRGDEALPIPGLCADPRFVDRSLDPNQRTGDFPLGVPQELNHAEGFLADGVTARSFLDQWYRPTTSADLSVLCPGLDVPVLSVAFGADHLVFPSQTLRVATSLPSRSTVWTLDGARHNPRAQPDHLDALSWKLLAWLGQAQRAQSGASWH